MTPLRKQLQVQHMQQQLMHMMALQQAPQAAPATALVSGSGMQGMTQSQHPSQDPGLLGALLRA